MMRSQEDQRTAKVVEKRSEATSARAAGEVKAGQAITRSTTFWTGGFSLGANAATGSSFSLGGEYSKAHAAAIEKAYETADSKIRELNHLLPRLHEAILEFFRMSKRISTLFLQIDDFYHLARPIQPYVMDYVHRFCKGFLSISKSQP